MSHRRWCSRVMVHIEAVGALHVEVTFAWGGWGTYGMRWGREGYVAGVLSLSVTSALWISAHSSAQVPAGSHEN